MKLLARKLGLAVTWVICGALGSAHVVQAEEALGEQQVRQLLDDKTWELRWQGPGFPPAYWDWSADGSICARLMGAAKEDECADTGQWRIEGDDLCWKLEWWGKTSGYNSGCVRVVEVSEGAYKAVRRAGYDAFVFKMAE